MDIANQPVLKKGSKPKLALLSLIGKNGDLMRKRSLLVCSAIVIPVFSLLPTMNSFRFQADHDRMFAILSLGFETL